MKTIFRKTEKSDTESLKKLWLSCFDEDVTAINLIFDSGLFDGCCAVVDDRIVSALYLVKGTLNGEKSHYLCGASTDESFRGNGIMSRLINLHLMMQRITVMSILCFFQQMTACTAFTQSSDML